MENREMNYRSNRDDKVNGITILCALFLALSLLTGPAKAAPLYSIGPLETMEGQVDVFAKGVNNLGQAVGYTADQQGRTHAVLWDDRGIHPLPNLSDAFPNSQAYRINDSGQIV